MRPEVVRLDLGARRRSTIGYAVGMAAYALVIVAIYPSFAHSTSLDSLTKDSPTLAALFGATGSLTSPSGWLNVNLYANVFPLVVLIATIGYGAACIAGQDEDGTLAMVTTLPIPRRRIVLEKAMALAVQSAVIVAVVTAAVAVGRWFDITVGVAGLVGASVGVWLLGVTVGLVAVLVGAATGSRGTALGVASALATVSYLISSLAPVVSWVRPLRFASLFYWAVGNDQLTAGLSVGDFAVLGGTACVLALGAVLAFERLDLH